MNSTGTSPVSPSAPLVCVVVPCFNHGRFLPEALASVRDQTYAHVECVVVDDGSSDAETLRVLADVEAQGVRVIRQTNQGLAAARNTGVRATQAEFFVPLDADDRLEPRLVERLLPPLLAEPTLGYCYSHVRFFGAETGIWRCRPYDPRRLLAENLSVATAVVRRSAFDAVGGYQSDMTDGFEDWDFWIALLAAGYSGRCVPEPLFDYRRHTAGSMLTRAMPRKPAMLDRIISHHRGLFARLLNVPANDADIRAAQAALVKLLTIEDSRFWRWLGWMAGGLATLDHEDQRRQLARIEASRTHRLIQRLKSTRLYREYARRAYPD